jgi:hypothetical protein
LLYSLIHIAIGRLIREIGHYKNKSGRNMPKNSEPDSLAGVAQARDERAATLLQVRCTIIDGLSFPIRVRNLSSQGLGGLCLHKVELQRDEKVHITFRNITPIGGHVIWHESGEVGIRFDRQINIARIAEARAWNGPEFIIEKHHEIAERCYRPAIRNTAKLKP